MFLALFVPYIMKKIRKIVGAVFEICRYARTHVRTHVRTEAILQLPSVFNRGPISEKRQKIKNPLGTFFYPYLSPTSCQV